VLFAVIGLIVIALSYAIVNAVTDTLSRPPSQQQSPSQQQPCPDPPGGGLPVPC
jgi:hypothetical protein